MQETPLLISKFFSVPFASVSMTFDTDLVPNGLIYRIKAVSALRFAPSGAGSQDFNMFPLGGIYLVSAGANPVQDSGALAALVPDLSNRGLYLGPRNSMSSISYGETTTFYNSTPNAEECGITGLDLFMDRSVKIRFIYVPVGVVSVGSVQDVILSIAGTQINCNDATSGVAIGESTGSRAFASMSQTERRPQERPLRQPGRRYF
jgi:hypothetical protein